MPADVARAPLSGAWAADVDTDGDLDLIGAGGTGAPSVLRNNGDGTVRARSRRFTVATRVRGFVWADIDGEGVPDAALLDERDAVRVVPEPARRRVPRAARAGQAAARWPRSRPRRSTGDAVMDVVACRPDGAVAATLAAATDGRRGRPAEITRVDPPTGLSPGTRPPARRRHRQQRRRRPHRVERIRRPTSCWADRTRRFGRSPPRSRWPCLPRPPTSTATAGWIWSAPARPARASRASQGREELPLAVDSAARHDRDRRSAHQLVRHRRGSRSAHGAARAEADDRRAGRPLRAGRGDQRRGRAHHLAERRPAIGVRPRRATRRSPPVSG